MFTDFDVDTHVKSGDCVRSGLQRQEDETALEQPHPVALSPQANYID
jgi:hypothetical protein